MTGPAYQPRPVEISTRDANTIRLALYAALSVMEKTGHNPRLTAEAIGLANGILCQTEAARDRDDA